MDPLSITASAIAILQLTQSIIVGTNNFYKSARDCPAEIRGLLDELTSFENVLESLQLMVEKANGVPQTKNVLPKQNNQKRLPTTCKMLEPGAPLDICYNKMTEFKNKLSKDKTKVGKVLKWPFRKDEIYAVIGRLRNIQSLLTMAIASDTAQLNLQIQDCVADITASLDATELDNLSQKIVTWLAAPDPSSNYNSAREKHHSDTGLWLLDSRPYLEWKNQPASLLWLHGKAGCGKTILSSTVIHDLSIQKPGESRNICIYFYFDFQTRQKQTFESCLCSLLVQLLSRAPRTLVGLKKLFAAHDNGRSSPSKGSLLEAFRQAIVDVGLVYLVLDALDECTERSHLLQSLMECCRWGLPSLHIITTSRKETDIEDCLIELARHKVCLEESVVDSDIRSFVHEQIQKDSKLMIWPSDIRALIESTLLDGAHGMFRWVVCQIDVIRECKKPNQVRRALKTLPKTLDETYERILTNIPDHHVEDVRRVLQCLICSFHPLDVKEVADIVAIDTAEPYYDPENRYPSPRELLSVCSGLVSTRTSKRPTDRTSKMRNIRLGNGFEIEELRLAHFSVKEYLVSERVNLGSASIYKLDEVSCHRTLADLCISYLLQFEAAIYDGQSVTKTSDPKAQERWDEELERWDKELKTQKRGHFEDIYLPGNHPFAPHGHFEDLHLPGKHPFAPYAAMFWSTHLRAARLDVMTPLHPKSMKLITNAALLHRIVNYHRWWFDVNVSDALRHLGIQGKRRRYDPITSPLNSRISPVYYASLLGLDYHVSQLLEEGESANSTGPSGTALAVAASKGQKSTVQLLLKMGANVDAQEVWRIERDGNTILSKTALHSAIEKGHEDLVHVLLDNGAAVNTKLVAYGSSTVLVYNTPLQEAVNGGNTSLVKTLLDRGADVSVDGGRHGNALYMACNVMQDVSVARLLLENGADPNAPHVRWPSALTFAIRGENEPLQQLLIEYGADIALVDFGYVRDCLRDYGEDKKKIEDSIAQTKVRLAHFESLPKRSIAISDSGE